MELSSTPWLFENIKTMVSSLIQDTNSTKYAAADMMIASVPHEEQESNPLEW